MQGRRDRLLCTNRAEIVEIYFALARTGIVGLPLNYRLAEPEILELMRAMGAKGLIFEAKFSSIAKQAATQLKHLLQIGGDQTDFAVGCEKLSSEALAHAPDIEIEESDPFYFNLTSGTTGLPKSYILTQYNNGGFWPNVSGVRHDKRGRRHDSFPDIWSHRFRLDHRIDALRSSKCPCRTSNQTKHFGLLSENE